MQSIVLLLWLALCSEQDVRQRQISNMLTLGVAACALAWLFATGRSWIGADASDAGWALAIVMLLTLPGYMLGRFGADDVKLIGRPGPGHQPAIRTWHLHRRRCQRTAVAAYPPTPVDVAQPQGKKRACRP
ncbi:peptidase A24A prepilin type IV [Pseudomonas putida S11]|nr:peptidase A24A prepilin type IV [Pseudomonas putida S11]